MGRPANLVVNILGNSYDLQKALGAGGNAVSAFARGAAGAGKAFAAVWTGAAVGAAAVTVSVFKTGVAYNALQQQAGAAFKTILGSSAAAQSMMEDLTVFARKSPFPKQAYISATQQMLAFGVASKRVIPYLQAVTDGVAAAGGSAQDLSEITTVMAQIQAAGKITGQDLMQFGQHGLNAADLIGASMGKTAAQIKNEITAGSLDATTALDALAAGMEKRYAGAAALVKQTWAGTKDSIAGAVRDIGSALAEPFVSAGGGGLAVEWGGKIATILRSLIPIVQEVMSALLKAFGPTLKTVGGALDFIQSKLGSIDVGALVSGLGKIAPVLGALTGAFGAISGGLFEQIPVIGKLLGGLSGPIGIVAAALAGLIATSPDLQKVLGGALQDAMKALAPVLPIITGALGQLAGILGDVVKSAAPLIAVIGGALGKVLASIVPLILQLAQLALPLVTAAMDLLSPIITMVAQTFADLMPPITQLVSTLLPPLVKIFQMVMSAIAPILPLLAQLLQIVVKVIVAAIMPFVPVLGQLLKALMPILQPVLQLVGALLQLLSPILKLLSPILQLAGLLVGVLAGAIGKLLTGGLKLLGPIIHGIAAAFMAVVDAVKQVINWFAKLKPPAWLSNGIKGIKDMLKAGPTMSGLSYSPPLYLASGSVTYAATSAPRALPASAYSQRPVNVYVQTPFKGDEIARTIRRELVALDRRERGIVLQGASR